MNNVKKFFPELVLMDLTAKTKVLEFVPKPRDSILKKLVLNSWLVILFIDNHL